MRYDPEVIRACALLVLGSARSGKPIRDRDAIALAKMVLDVPGAIAGIEEPCNECGKRDPIYVDPNTQRCALCGDERLVR